MTLKLLRRTAASHPFTTTWLNPMSLGSKIDQPQKECPSRAQPPSDFRDTSHRLHGRRFSLAQEKQRCARSKLIQPLLLSNACTQPSALAIVIELRATVQRTAAFLRDDGLMVPKENASIEVQSNATSQHTRRRRRWGLAQAERLREGYRYSVPSGAQQPGIRS